jgi:exportin-5
MLPLRPTKNFLTCSVEKIDKSTKPYAASCELWQDSFPIILPLLLQFMTHAHASHTASNWTRLPAEMQSIVSRVLSDRFWQAGISEGTKDDFYARVTDKKHTMEGLASTIRGTIRFVRESCYAIIYCMSRLDMQFYGFNELPGPLAHALLADSFSLSSHHLINLLNLVRYLVDNCPVGLRDHFLPPILAACFQQMDAKINSEWQQLDQQQSVQSGGETLAEEMKAESILRQLTYDGSRLPRPGKTQCYFRARVGVVSNPAPVLSNAVHCHRATPHVLHAYNPHEGLPMLWNNASGLQIHHPRVRSQSQDERGGANRGAAQTATAV